jgi:hypothetical protein
VQLLQRLEHLAVADRQSWEVGADDRDRGPVALDVHVQVTVEVGDVEQLLEVVGRDVALALELLDAQRLRLVAGPRRLVVLSVEAGARSPRLPSPSSLLVPVPLLVLAALALGRRAAARWVPPPWLCAGSWLCRLGCWRCAAASARGARAVPGVAPSSGRSLGHHGLSPPAFFGPAPP